MDKSQEIWAWGPNFIHNTPHQPMEKQRMQTLKNIIILIVHCISVPKN